MHIAYPSEQGLIGWFENGWLIGMNSEPRAAIYRGFFEALHPIYVRGEAYLAPHQGAAAVREFQKIIDHRGIVISDVIGALAYVQLGRAYAMAGDNAKAQAALPNVP